MKKSTIPALLLALTGLLGSSIASAEGAYLEITLKIDKVDRQAAGEVYAKYKQPFLETVPGATSKELLIRTDDVQVLHRFGSTAEAEAYLASKLFKEDVVAGLSPLLKADPVVSIYKAH